ncbi:MAG: fluoride efflux transporter CrcB [Desulfobacteraceae bacterium]|jgi:CrcB protein
MLKVVIIGVGGSIGAILRYLVSGIVQNNVQSAAFPYGTMAVNLLGCLLIGIGGGLMTSRQLFSPEMRSFFFIGILGSFTTFSTFSLETFNLIKNGQNTTALIYLGGSIIIGLLAVYLGFIISKTI